MWYGTIMNMTRNNPVTIWMLSAVSKQPECKAVFKHVFPPAVNSLQQLSREIDDEMDNTEDRAFRPALPGFVGALKYERMRLLSIVF